jgi:hypothetical protein
MVETRSGDRNLRYLSQLLVLDVTRWRFRKTLVDSLFEHDVLPWYNANKIDIKSV